MDILEDYNQQIKSLKSQLDEGKFGDATPSSAAEATPHENINTDVFENWAKAMVCKLRAANPFYAHKAMYDMDAIALTLFK